MAQINLEWHGEVGSYLGIHARYESCYFSIISLVGNYGNGPESVFSITLCDNDTDVAIDSCPSVFYQVEDAQEECEFYTKNKKCDEESL